MTNAKYVGTITKGKPVNGGVSNETFSLKLSNPKPKLSEYEKNIFDTLNEMTIQEQVSIAMSSLSRKVEFENGNHTTFTNKLISEVEYHQLNLKEIVKLKAYIATYFGKTNLRHNEYENTFDKRDFVSELTIKGPLVFITIRYTNVMTPGIDNNLLFQLPIPESLLKTPKVVVAAYFVITNLLQVLLTGEL